MRHPALRAMAIPAMAALGLAFLQPAAAQERVRIGVLNDQSGPYADASGPGSVIAAQLAAEEFHAAHPSIPVEILSADHANKADVASAIARRWLEVEHVDAVADIQNSAIALAVQNIANQDGKVSLATGAVSPELSGKSCSPTGVHWSMDAYSLATGPVRALADKKRWFFMTVDLAGGHLFESEGRAAVAAAGGEVVGSVRHPLGTTDMSSYLLQAQAAGANVIALANAGADTINSIKGANEFGLVGRGISIAPLLMFEPDIKAVGLPLAQGMVISTSFYWDLNDESRAFAKRFAERFHRMPTQYQASTYAIVRHYLASVAAVKSVDGPKVIAAMRATPAYYFSDHLAQIRPDGRTIYDVYVMQVKKPEESKGEWDLLRLVQTVPGALAFRPAEQSQCPLMKKPAL